MFDLKTSYWNNCGAEQATYDRLYAELVSNEGDSATVEGELLRAISKVYYDNYNNGLGNDMRGPVAFMMEHFSSPGFSIIYGQLSDMAPDNRDSAGLNEELLENLTTSIIRYVVSKNGQYTPLGGEGMWSKKYINRIEVPDDDYYDDEEDC
jgi:hypothetical protein